MYDMIEEENFDEESEDRLMEMTALLLVSRRKRKQNQRKVKKARKKPRFWIRDIFLYSLITELRDWDREYFFRY